jgi:uncharacterized repeat protein (TIGR03803 family)
VRTSYGTVFRITPNGVLTTLHHFCSQGGCTDGANPTAGLVQGADGNFYGTTFYGGVRSYGTVFKITPSGVLTTLHSFCTETGCPDGAGPSAGLVQANNGDFYGTTDSGGNGYGTIFKMTSSGALTTLHRFCSHSGCAGYPNGLIQAGDGNLYGTTRGLGTSHGTVFKMTPRGALTTVYRFCSEGPPCADGLELNAALVQAGDGNFYGTTSLSGGHGGGTIFRITPGGTLTTLYAFCSQSGCADGKSPYGGLIQDSDGSLYGTTRYGGANGGIEGYGTIFRLSLGLPPSQ